MKRIQKVTIGIIIISIILVSFQGAVSATSFPHISFSLKQQLSESTSTSNLDTLGNNEQNPLWYPGFLLIQLVKGVMAFIIILLILLDIIEPS